jgi:hypothetical protein
MAWKMTARSLVGLLLIAAAGADVYFDWREWGAREAQYAPAEPLARAQYMTIRLGQELQRRGIDPNYSYFGRTWSAAKHGDQSLGTCQDLATVVNDALSGAGFRDDQLYTVMASKEGFQRIKKGWLFDVNLDHVCPVVVIDGVPCTFDLWAQGGTDGHFANFKGSVWNGLPLKAWIETMRQYNYTAFTVNPGRKDAYGPETGERVIAEILRRGRPTAMSSLAAPPAKPTADAIVSEYQAVYPVFLKTFHSGSRVEVLASAEKRGDQYFSAHKVYCIVQDGPRKGEEYCCASFERLHTLAQLQAAAAEMRRYLDPHR